MVGNCKSDFVKSAIPTAFCHSSRPDHVLLPFSRVGNVARLCSGLALFALFALLFTLQQNKMTVAQLPLAFATGVQSLH
jgi:hypothetical protein